MTNELEKKFFDTFGIEAKYKCAKDGNCYFQECSKCDWYICTYPQITNDMWLSLVLIVLEYRDYPKTTNKKKYKRKNFKTFN